MNTVVNSKQKKAPSDDGRSSRLGRAVVDMGERFSVPGFENLAFCAVEAILRAWVGIWAIGEQIS